MGTRLETPPVRVKVARRPVHGVLLLDKPLGLSVGLVVYEARSNETPDQLTQRADEAMYSAKRAGKGRVRVGRRLEQ